MVGCQGAPRPIFPEPFPPIIWPAAPDRPRIRYIGQLTGEASLQVKPTGLDALRAIFTGPKPTVSFSTPLAVAAVAERVYIADGQLGVIHVLDLAARTYSTINQAAGQPLQWPIDVIALDAGTIAVADSRRQAIFLYDSTGRFVRSIGEGLLQRPTSVAYDASAGELWALDTAAHSLVAFDRQGGLARRLGGRGGEPLRFNFPAGLSYHGQTGLVVADSMNFRVQVLDRDGSSTSVFGSKGDAAGNFALPRDVAVDSEGHIFVLDNQFENVQAFDRSGQLLMAFGQEGHGPGEFYLPSGIAIDERDRIWIADTYNRRVQVFQYLREGGGS